MRHGKVLAAALGVILADGAVVAYVATMPSAETHRSPVARVSAPDSSADIAAQAQAENSYDGGEKKFDVVAKREHAKDTPVIDVCTGKPIHSGPTIDITDKSTDCPPPTAT